MKHDDEKLTFDKSLCMLNDQELENISNSLKSLIEESAWLSKKRQSIAKTMIKTIDDKITERLVLGDKDE